MLKVILKHVLDQHALWLSVLFYSYLQLSLKASLSSLSYDMEREPILLS